MADVGIKGRVKKEAKEFIFFFRTLQNIRFFSAGWDMYMA